MERIEHPAARRQFPWPRTPGEYRGLGWKRTVMIRKQHRRRWKNRFRKKNEMNQSALVRSASLHSPKKPNYFRVENRTKAHVFSLFSRKAPPPSADSNSRFSQGVVCQSLGAQTSLAASPAQPHPVSIRRHAGAENIQGAESPRRRVSPALQKWRIQRAAGPPGVLLLRCRAGKPSGGHVKHDRSADAADLLVS